MNSWFWEEINKIDKHLARLSTEKDPIKLGYEKGYIITDIKVIQKIIRDYLNKYTTTNVT
jgi:hypothetical protein